MKQVKPSDLQKIGEDVHQQGLTGFTYWFEFAKRLNDLGNTPAAQVQMDAVAKQADEFVQEQTEKGWLIEKRLSGEEPVWLWVEDWFGFKWTPHALQAMRFSRREDAEQLALLLEGEDISITDHEWVALAGEESAKPVRRTKGGEDTKVSEQTQAARLQYYKDYLKKLPQYKCHKVVGALKIKNIVFDWKVAANEGRDSDGSATITPADSGFYMFRLTRAFVNKHLINLNEVDIIGGYFVVYDGGYQSFSPAKAFEDGYAPIGVKE